MRTHLDKLIRKDVIVRASGFSYRGILLEVTSEAIYLRGPTGFTTIPMDRVSSVVGAEEKSQGLNPDRSVSQSFYDADLYSTDQGKTEEAKAPSNPSPKKDPKKR